MTVRYCNQGSATEIKVPKFFLLISTLFISSQNINKAQSIVMTELTGEKSGGREWLHSVGRP